MGEVSGRVGIAGRMMPGGADMRFQWLVDDRYGEHALGGFYFCEVEHQHDGWIGFIEWVETADEASRFFGPNVEWLPASESEQMMAVLPVQSLRLDRLVDEGRVTELLELENVESIARTWMRYQNTDAHSRDRLRDWWAIQIWLGSAVLEDEEWLREGLLRLVAAAESDDDFALVGAGPMEDFLDFPTESRLSWIETQAQQSPSFRRALANVWIWSIPEDAFVRVERAAGVPLARPGS